MTVDVSLLICTRDRGASLDRALASITRAAAAAQGLRIEAVVVDNGSRDDTPARIAAWRVAQDFAVHGVTVETPGLARARNAGLAVARGQIVAMTDDDCVLHPGYLRALAARFAQVDGPAIIGGRILQGDAADWPMTIKLEDHPMILDDGAFPGGFVMGANMAFTRDVVDRIGPFDTRFGAGAPFRSAEDTDFLFRAAGHGIAVLYDPTFAVDHHHGRRSEAGVIALLAGYAFGDGALYAKHLLRDSRVAMTLLRDIRDVVREVATPVSPCPSIRHSRLFRLRHAARGAFAYLREARRA